MKNITAFLSEDSEWGTPQVLFDKLNALFNFEMDLCATENNHKMKPFISPEQDSFTVEWDFKSSYLNPPYGEPENKCGRRCKKKKCEKRGFHADRYIPGVIDWVNRAQHMTVKYEGTRIVSLLPARTETKWFQTIWDHACFVLFFKGRLSFEPSTGEKAISAPYPSVLVGFGEDITETQAEELTEFGNLVLPGEGVLTYQE